MFFKAMIILPMILAALTTPLVPHAQWSWFFGFYYAYQVLCFCVLMLYGMLTDDTKEIPQPQTKTALDSLRAICQYQINRGYPVKLVIDTVCKDMSVMDTALIMGRLELPEADLEKTWNLPHVPA